MIHNIVVMMTIMMVMNTRKMLMTVTMLFPAIYLPYSLQSYLASTSSLSSLLSLSQLSSHSNTSLLLLPPCFSILRLSCLEPLNPTYPHTHIHTPSHLHHLTPPTPIPVSNPLVSVYTHTHTSLLISVTLHTSRHSSSLDEVH